jgi:2-dehydropantoate 2-reductase
VLRAAGSRVGTVQRVLVIGAGAIGGLLAAKLSAGPDVAVALAVRAATPPLTFTAGGVESNPPVALVTEIDDAEPFAWVVVATKAYDVAGLAPWLDSPAIAGARIAVAQNGVDQVERLSRFVAAERVMPVIVTYGAERLEPGCVTQTLAGTTRVPSGATGEAFAALAAGTPLGVELVDDFVGALWTKLTWNVVGNSLSTISNVPVREIGRRPELRWVACRLVEECRAVGRLEGGAVAPGLAERVLDAFAELPATVRSSMWQDRAAGRRLEHDAISGAVARAAGRHGVDAPFSEMATRLLDALSPT